MEDYLLEIGLAMGVVIIITMIILNKKLRS